MAEPIWQQWASKGYQTAFHVMREKLLFVYLTGQTRHAG